MLTYFCMCIFLLRKVKFYLSLRVFGEREREGGKKEGREGGSEGEREGGDEENGGKDWRGLSKGVWVTE